MTSRPRAAAPAPNPPAGALTFDDATASEAILGVYRQAFSVLARESGAMIDSPELLEVDEAILAAFAEAGSDGLTAEEIRFQCSAFPAAAVTRRCEVLLSYGALRRVVDRANERHYRAAFAPYIMLLFLRRLGQRGGQTELHQLLTLEQLGVDDPTSGPDTGRQSTERLARIFRLLANELAILATGGAVEELRANAQLLWGNRRLIEQTEQVHSSVLSRWPELERDCTELRLALAAYADATEAAASRLIDQAGSTRALGLLPAETWRTFARTSSLEALAAVLNGFLFDAPAPWFDPQDMADAVASGRTITDSRIPPPRIEAGDADAPPPPPESGRLSQIIDGLLGNRESVSLADALDPDEDWVTARRILADLTAAHHDPDVAVEIEWSDRLDITPSATLTWYTEGRLVRRPTEAPGPGQAIS